MNINDNLTPSEIVKYCLPDNLPAELREKLADYADSHEEIDPMSYELDEVKKELETANEKLQELAAYQDFFTDCFDRLESVYPCPSISNDYDQSIIMDTIRAGSIVLDRINELENDSNKTSEEVTELELLRGLVE